MNVSPTSNACPNCHGQLHQVSQNGKTDLRCFRCEVSFEIPSDFSLSVLVSPSQS